MFCSSVLSLIFVWRLFSFFFTLEWEWWERLCLRPLFCRRGNTKRTHLGFRCGGHCHYLVTCWCGWYCYCWRKHRLCWYWWRWWTCSRKRWWRQCHPLGNSPPAPSVNYTKTTMSMLMKMQGRQHRRRSIKSGWHPSPAQLRPCTGIVCGCTATTCTGHHWHYMCWAPLASYTKHACTRLVCAATG